MNKKSILFLISIILLQGFAYRLFAEGEIEESIEISNAQLSAIGGLHAAHTEGTLSIFTNPAGLSTQDPEFLLSEITLGLTGPVFDIISKFVGGEDPLTDPDLYTLLLENYGSIDLVGPISFAYAGGGLGFGLFSWTELEFEPSGANALSASTMLNFLITTGYAFKIPLPGSTLDIGAQLKGLARGSTYKTTGMLELMSSMMSDPVSIITTSEVCISLGIGADAGIIYSLGDIFSAGIAARNFMVTIRNEYEDIDVFLGNTEGETTQGTGYLPLDLSAGIKFSPPLGNLKRFFNDFVIYLDYIDILDMLTHPATARHVLLHFSLGLELKLLEILSIRGGFAEALFAAGLGLDLTIFKLNIAMFGSERSIQPSELPVYNLIIGIEFKL